MFNPEQGLAGLSSRRGLRDFPRRSQEGPHVMVRQPARLRPVHPEQERSKGRDAVLGGSRHTGLLTFELRSWTSPRGAAGAHLLTAGSNGGAGLGG